MQLTEDLIESSMQITREFVTPIVSSNRGENDEALKLDGMFFFDILVVKILLPFMVSVTSKVFVDKIQNSNKSYKELNKALMSLAGSQIAPLGKKKKKELVETAAQQLGKFGASKEQAQELVEMIVKEIKKQEKKQSGSYKKLLKK